MVTYTTTVKEANGELYLELPQEFWDSVGWQVGDTVVWTDNSDGSWTLRKKDERSTLHNRV